MVTDGQVIAWVPHGRGASSGYISKITAPIEFTAWIREQTQAKLRTYWKICIYIYIYLFIYLFVYLYIYLGLVS